MLRRRLFPLCKTAGLVDGPFGRKTMRFTWRSLLQGSRHGFPRA